MAINCGHCHEPHNNVQEVRDCSRGMLITAPLHRPKEITEGMWYLGGVIVKVQKAKVTGSGQLYCKRLTALRPQPEDEGVTQWEFQYFPEGMTRLRTSDNVRKMTIEEAAEFGKLYGICCRCGRDLTDENSIAAGIGPICAEKF